MEPVLRPARADDHASIRAWTQDTFSWGDYVADRFPDWVGDESGQVLVLEVDGTPVALARATIVGAGEAWAHAMRVHPDHRRQGYGTTVTEGLVAWARDQGAQVIRLAIEGWNTNPQAQVSAIGFRPVCDWLAVERAIGESSPVPAGNGGRRVPPPERLRVASSAEAEPAFLSWVGGELARSARGLFGFGWTWRRLTADHLTDAARSRRLLEGRPGWAIAEVYEGGFSVHWLETAPDDARAMVRALVDRAADVGAEAFTAMIPAVGWLQREFRRLAFDLRPLTVWAKSL